MLVFLAIVFALYVVLVLILCWGWASLDDETVTSQSFSTISVLIVFRNEESSLPLLFASLKNLEYPRDKVEVILVDDHSDDQSTAIVRNLIDGEERYTLITPGKDTKGKKSGLTAAVAKSTGDIVVLTDADCQVPSTWLMSINNAFAKNSTQLVAGPVRLSDQDWFAQVQGMEFASLIGATGATIAFGRPVMCNAANLAFRRSAFLEVDGFAGNEDISSGDDQFLMKKIADRWKRSVVFLNDEEAVVTARASSTLGGLIQQRLRWAGKWSLALDASSWLALFILGFHVCYMVLIGAWIYGTIPTPAFVALASARLFVESIYLFPVCRFLGTRWRWSSFLFLQVFYPIYVVSIGFLSQILAARWKGREVATGVWTGIS